ncbi:transposable element, partial [Tanacetum coccineum]
MDATTLRFLISLANAERLQMRLMDVVTAYLYGSLDSDIYMKISEGLKMPEACKSKPREMFSIKLKRSLYGLKQSGRMWYNRLSEYLSKEGYKSNQISPCVFIKRSKGGFTIIAVYVDDLNIIGNLEEIEHTAKLLKNEFEMKDLVETR